MVCAIIKVRMSKINVLKALPLVLCLIASLCISSCQINKSSEDTQMPSNTEDTQILLNTYVISPKREFRATVNKDWQGSLTKIQGLEVLGGNSRRIKVKATPESIEAAKNKLGKGFYVEPSIEHHHSF